ncbi:helix-turn-helix transcriptional regulator [Tenacibaculum pacificus]|uniref:helix-turn-helix transcriptional regulator n=1 Tax=Tenacibaculum pacificus TaxID=3018314 RepID=UPI0022F3D30F|nr:helix-turn-helix transcriptional regulator [Tenacibaculum pacificus]WBX74338.1 helix-turn-helix transcriptional regulator [Tenacibaculum pacificus]
MMSLNHKNIKTKKVITFIDNKTIYNSEYAELNIFKTYETTKNVFLNFDNTVIASMMTGKMIMHFDKTKPFLFTKGATLVIPEENNISIDFPEASLTTPTTYSGLVINQNKINEVVYHFNENTAIERENNNWDFKKQTSHLNNDTEINILINKLTNTFINNSKSKNALLDLMIQELIIRLLQSKARKLILKNVNDGFSDTRISYAIKYIKENLTKNDLSLDKISEKACMSKSHFFKKFKSTLGVTPIDYINSEKIKFAKQLIKNNPNQNISDIAYKTGFNNVTYFNRIFKKRN